MLYESWIEILTGIKCLRNIIHIENGKQSKSQLYPWSFEICAPQSWNINIALAKIKRWQVKKSDHRFVSEICTVYTCLHDDDHIDIQMKILKKAITRSVASVLNIFESKLSHTPIRKNAFNVNEYSSFILIEFQYKTCITS